MQILNYSLGVRTTQPAPVISNAVAISDIIVHMELAHEEAMRKLDQVHVDALRNLHLTFSQTGEETTEPKELYSTADNFVDVPLCSVTQNTTLMSWMPPANSTPTVSRTGSILAECEKSTILAEEAKKHSDVEITLLDQESGLSSACGGENIAVEAVAKLGGGEIEEESVKKKSANARLPTEEFHMTLRIID